MNPEELWWQEKRLSLLSVILRRGAEKDKRGPEVFYLSGSPDPITPSLHVGGLVVVAPGFTALVCLSLAVISICPFLPSVFFFQLVSITLFYFPPFLICHPVWRTVAVCPSALFTQSAYGRPQSSVTPASARRAWKGVWLIDHIGIPH